MDYDTRPQPAEVAPAGKARRRFVATATTLFLLPVIPRLAHASTIVAVRTWPADEYTRVTLEMDSELKAEHFTLENPHRMVVDIQGLTMNRTIEELVSKVRPNDPYIRSVRVGQNRPDVVRLVLDLKQAVAPQIFTLKPVAEYKYRLVLDLYPRVAQDPLLALQIQDDNDPLASVLESLAQNSPDAPVPTVQGQTLPPVVRTTPPPVTTPPRSPSPAATPGTPNRPLLIALDPGHGGEDPGAIGPGGTREKDVVLNIARRLKRLIDSQPNMRTYLTRDSDFFVPLQVRVQKARRVKADLFISIHCNSAVRIDAEGSETYHFPDSVKGRQLARCLQFCMTDAMLTEDRGVKEANFQVLRETNCPAALVECAFISNPVDREMLVDSLEQWRMGAAIAVAVCDYEIEIKKYRPEAFTDD